MNPVRKIIIFMLLTALSFVHLSAYSYASAGKEPTLDAQDTILKALNKNNFKEAKIAFTKYAAHYKYLNDDFNNHFYKGLETAILDGNKEQTLKLLKVSIAIEVQRRLDGGLKNIHTFNVAKVMLAKANKFYKILSPNLDKENNKLLINAIKACMVAIGNPGLFGVGAKEADLLMYKKNHAIAIKVLNSL